MLYSRISGKVGLYVCGMTVYDYCHIGHARVMIVFDMVVRYLRHLTYDVTYVRNITDIDDKIIQRARENNENFNALTARFIDAMHEDERALFVLPPNIEPRATQHIPSIIGMIEKLIHQNFAYIGSNGDVFYAVNQFATYGQLSGKHLNELHAGERIDVDLAKRNPLDFVLWKWQSQTNPHGHLPGEEVDLDGILNAPPCQQIALAIPLTFMAVAWISNFPIMKMKLHNLRAQPAKNSLIFGCIMDLSALMRKRCLNLSGTFLLFVRY
jgi:hypothetical protein